MVGFWVVGVQFEWLDMRTAPSAMDWVFRCDMFRQSKRAGHGLVPLERGCWTVHLIIKCLCWFLKQFTWLSSTCVESSKSSLNYQVPVLSPQSHEGVLLCAFVKLRRATVSLYAFFWVIPRRLNFICGRFGTLCSIFMGRYAHLPAYEVGTDSVPKRRHIKFRRRGITQKKAYNIQYRVKVLNQDYRLFLISSNQI